MKPEVFDAGLTYSYNTFDMLTEMQIFCGNFILLAEKNFAEDLKNREALQALATAKITFFKVNNYHLLFF